MRLPFIKFILANVCFSDSSPSGQHAQPCKHSASASPLPTEVALHVKGADSAISHDVHSIVEDSGTLIEGDRSSSETAQTADPSDIDDDLSQHVPRGPRTPSSPPISSADEDGLDIPSALPHGRPELARRSLHRSSGRPYPSKLPSNVGRSGSTLPGSVESGPEPDQISGRDGKALRSSARHPPYIQLDIAQQHQHRHASDTTRGTSIKKERMSSREKSHCSSAGVSLVVFLSFLSFLRNYGRGASD